MDLKSRLESLARQAGFGEAELRRIQSEINASQLLGYADILDGRSHDERKDLRDRVERREQRQDRLTILFAIIGSICFTTILIFCVRESGSQEKGHVIDRIVSGVIGSASGLGGGYALGRNLKRADHDAKHSHED